MQNKSCCKSFLSINLFILVLFLSLHRIPAPVSAQELSETEEDILVRERVAQRFVDYGLGEVYPCFYGDSRVVGMSQISNGYTCIGQVSGGYDFMSGAGMTYLNEQMDKDPDMDVVFCFGINDLGNIDRYISFYRTFVNDHPDTYVWFMSVDPVDEALARRYGYSVTNAQVEAFNEALKEAFPDRYIDTFGYLVNERVTFSTLDGVHYSSETYAQVQEYAADLILSYRIMAG